MAINAWWVPSPQQRYWMEATGRRDLGEALRAPKGGTANQSVWNYDLVGYTSPGDVVFHWHTDLVGRPAIVGWSVVVGPLGVGMFPWTPKQGFAKSELAEPRVHWSMPLGGIHLLDTPVTLDDLVPLRSKILSVRSELETHTDGPSYFPFTKYGSDKLRAMQGYVTKFPAELVDLLSIHFDLELGLAEGLGLDGDAVLSTVSAGGQGAVADTARRLAIERHAVRRAIDYYKSIGATNVEELGKPYDLRLQLDGEEVHIEVKGSSSVAGSVIVTRNEVKHAGDWPRTELFVVDNIGVKWKGEGLTAEGGMARRWLRWTPSPDSLIARTYDHTLSVGFVDLSE